MIPTAMESRPTVNEAANVQVSEAGYVTNSTASKQRIVLSDAAERWISEWACALVSGDLEFWQLPDSLRELFVYAYEDGRNANDRGEIERLRWERDLWFFCYTNKKTPAQYYRHQTNELWKEATA